MSGCSQILAELTIYQFAQFARYAYSAALGMSNVTQGFIKSGICPLNSKVFSKYDLFTSYVTDRPEPVPLDDATPENLIPTTPEFSDSYNDTSDASRSPNVQPIQTVSWIKNNSLSKRLVQPSTTKINC
ncbi:hypothetical protein JTB14_035848 [Gonioctena quinquepunctata]|nr:hypothetical protein JTB14_035848 [Gonioctena quinquepunctata]